MEPTVLACEGSPWENRLRLKNAADRFFAAIFFFLCSPFIVWVGFMMAVEGLFYPESRGPVFYRERRISQGKPFGLYKFRVLKKQVIESMGEKDSATFLQSDPSRTTFVGKLLIKTYLDEMPQFFHILLGQMSFVGPRPRIRPVYEEDLQEGFQALRYLKGGITGPHQLTKGILDNPRELSEEYLEKCRRLSPCRLLLYDLKVMWKTFYVLFRAEGL